MKGYSLFFVFLISWNFLSSLFILVNLFSKRGGPLLEGVNPSSSPSTSLYVFCIWLRHILYAIDFFISFCYRSFQVFLLLISVPYFIYFYFTHLYPFFLTVLISSAQFKLLSSWFDSYSCLYKSDPIRGKKMKFSWATYGNSLVWLLKQNYPVLCFKIISPFICLLISILSYITCNFFLYFFHYSPFPFFRYGLFYSGRSTSNFLSYSIFTLPFHFIFLYTSFSSLYLISLAGFLMANLNIKPCLFHSTP